MDLQDILEYCRAQAIANSLYPTEESVYRSICRKYSNKFSTPLHETVELDPEFVLMNYFESQMDDVDVDERAEDLLDTVYGIEDPEWENQKKNDLEQFILDAEKEEKDRIKKKRPIHKSLKFENPGLPEAPEVYVETPKSLPKQGGINLAYLSDEEEKSTNRF